MSQPADHVRRSHCWAMHGWSRRRAVSCAGQPVIDLRPAAQSARPG
uniref:Uncharacterized protein n=1 Tax=Setaria italica TaxID=4555 RepID=K3ZG37_SETIT